MPILKRIILFLVVFAVVYVGLMSLRTPVADAYARMFRAGGNIVFSRYLFWGDGSVHFVDLRLPSAQLFDEVDRHTYRMLPINTPTLKLKGELDTLLLLKNRSRMKGFGMLRTSSRMVGYTPTAFFVALFLATPVGWRKRLWVFIIGLVLAHGYIFVRLSIYLAVGEWGFGSAKPYALFSLGEFWSGILTRVNEVVNDNPMFYLPFAIFLWLAVNIFMGSLAEIRQSIEPEPESSSE